MAAMPYRGRGFKKYRDFIFFMLSVKKARDTYRLSARIIHSDVYYILVKV